MLSKTGKLRSGYEKITPPHLALIKVEIQAKGWFFICSLVPIAIGIGSFWIKPTAKHITNTKTNKY
jgi:hypothetical protein